MSEVLLFPKFPHFVIRNEAANLCQRPPFQQRKDRPTNLFENSPGD
jgi:hypothetical protein